MTFAYYPGCSSAGSSLDYDISTKAVCKALGIELVEIAGWNCCGSTPAHAIDKELSAAISVRNLDLATKANAKTVVTPCPSCLSNLKRAGKLITENSNFRSRVNELLDEPVVANLPEVTSVMQGIAQVCDMEKIKATVSKPLENLRVACYYGCLMSRPHELMQFGDPENPTLMEELLTACGAEVVDFPLKTECCGASFGIPERQMTAKNSGRLLKVAKELKLDALVVACPLCQMNLDLRQNQASSAMSTTFNMPIPYYTQLMGLAFGIKAEDLGFNKLCVDPAPLLQKFAMPLKNSQTAKGGRA